MTNVVALFYPAVTVRLEKDVLANIYFILFGNVIGKYYKLLMCSYGDGVCFFLACRDVHVNAPSLPGVCRTIPFLLGVCRKRWFRRLTTVIWQTTLEWRQSE